MLALHGDIGMAHSFLSAIATLCYAMLRFGSMRGFGGSGGNNKVVRVLVLLDGLG